MSWFNEFEDLTREENVLVYPRVSVNQHAQPVYSAVPHTFTRSLTTFNPRRVVNDQGEEVLAAGDCYVDATPEVKTIDKLVLVDGKTRRILAVDRYEDEPGEQQIALQRIAFA